MRWLGRSYQLMQYTVPELIAVMSLDEREHKLAAGLWKADQAAIDSIVAYLLLISTAALCIPYRGNSRYIYSACFACQGKLTIGLGPASSMPLDALLSNQSNPLPVQSAAQLSAYEPRAVYQH